MNKEFLYEIGDYVYYCPYDTSKRHIQGKVIGRKVKNFLIWKRHCYLVDFGMYDIEEVSERKIFGKVKS